MDGVSSWVLLTWNSRVSSPESTRVSAYGYGPVTHKRTTTSVCADIHISTNVPT